jgi:hypothetical protein
VAATSRSTWLVTAVSMSVGPCVPNDLSSTLREHVAPTEVGGHDAPSRGPGRDGKEVAPLFVCQAAAPVHWRCRRAAPVRFER